MKRFFSPTILRALTGAFLLTFFVLGLSPTRAQQPATSAAKPAVNCPRTDNEIVKDIYDQLKSDDVLKTQWKQIIVTAKNGVVRLRGWTKGPTAKRNVEKLVRATACVTKVNSQLSPTRSGSCPDGQKECGDGGCVGKDETCPLT